MRDAASVQEISATPALVAYLHARDKTVLAWVVNSRSSIMSMASNGVDNVITDDVSLVRHVVDEATQLSPIERLFNSRVAILE